MWVEEACRDGYVMEVTLPPKHTFGSGSGQCEFEATLEEYKASLPVPGFPELRSCVKVEMDVLGSHP